MIGLSPKNSLTAICTPLPHLLPYVQSSPAITPPSRIGTNITAAILAQIVTVNATIVATTTQSVAAAGAPSPTFPASAALVGTQLSTISAAIQTGLIQPQMV